MAGGIGFISAEGDVDLLGFGIVREVEPVFVLLLSSITLEIVDNRETILYQAMVPFWSCGTGAAVRPSVSS